MKNKKQTIVFASEPVCISGKSKSGTITLNHFTAELMTTFVYVDNEYKYYFDVNEIKNIENNKYTVSVQYNRREKIEG